MKTAQPSKRKSYPRVTIRLNDNLRGFYERKAVKENRKLSECMRLVLRDHAQAASK